MVSESRWRQAQEYEKGFWGGTSVATLAGTVSEHMQFWQRLDEQLLHLFLVDRTVLEIGAGPLGISVTSLHPLKSKIKRLIKVEPLPRVMFADRLRTCEAWARPFVDWVAALSEEGEYVQTSGEGVDLHSAVDTVITINVLDHVQDPEAILRNACSALRPGGWILISVDCRSVLGKIRFDQVLRRTRRGSLLVEAHPHTFTVADVVAMLRRTGFVDIEICGLPGRLKVLAGSAFTPVFVARKAGG